MYKRLTIILIFGWFLACETSKISDKILGISHKLLTLNLKDHKNSKYELLSPISISGALHMCLLGARGETYNNLKSFLGYEKGKFKKNL